MIRALADLKLSRSAATCAERWIWTGDSTCCFGVLDTTWCASSYSSLILPCLNFRSRWWMMLLMPWSLLRSEVGTGNRTNCSKRICSWSSGHGSKARRFLNDGCVAGLRASLLISTTDRKVSFTCCSSRHLILVVNGCRNGGGWLCSSLRNASPSAHSES